MFLVKSAVASCLLLTALSDADNRTMPAKNLLTVMVLLGTASGSRLGLLENWYD